MKNVAFDNAKYLKLQSEHILERISSFDNKLYLEFGGSCLTTITHLAYFQAFGLTAKAENADGIEG